jgi:hypothetical protein
MIRLPAGILRLICQILYFSFITKLLQGLSFLLGFFGNTLEPKTILGKASELLQSSCTSCTDAKSIPLDAIMRKATCELPVWGFRKSLSRFR